MKPGLKEHALITAIAALITRYSGRAPDPMLIVKAFTAPGMALDRFKARDFSGKIDIAAMIA
jgi:hypothetical protein